MRFHCLIAAKDIVGSLCKLQSQTSVQGKQYQLAHVVQMCYRSNSLTVFITIFQCLKLQFIGKKSCYLFKLITTLKVPELCWKESNAQNGMQREKYDTLEWKLPEGNGKLAYIDLCNFKRCFFLKNQFSTVHATKTS